jgi:hypothetical protein
MVQLFIGCKIKNQIKYRFKFIYSKILMKLDLENTLYMKTNYS